MGKPLGNPPLLLTNLIIKVVVIGTLYYIS